jgi:DNA-directed RNA polymerase specialized sigma24 family protein
MNPTLDELEERLKQLSITAQQHPPLSQQRQTALRELVTGILRSGRLCHPQRGNFLGFYDDIYDEALQELLLFVCQKIDKYDPERGTVMAWVNMLMERRFFREAIPRVMGKQETKRLSLVELDHLAAPETTGTLTDALKECIELDPENILKGEHIEHHPAANFQTLLKRRMLGQSWKEIAAEFDVKIPTVSGFYYRCLTKLSPKLREYCVNNLM